MRKQWSETLRAQFEIEFFEKHPEFERDLDAEKLLPSEMSVYRRRCGEHKAVFIVLFLSPKRGSFTFEGAWSEDGKFPTVGLALLPEEAVSVSSGIVRIGAFLPGEEMDHWWWLRNESSIPSVLKESLEAVDGYLVPFVLRFCASP